MLLALSVGNAQPCQHLKPSNSCHFGKQTGKFWTAEETQSKDDACPPGINSRMISERFESADNVDDFRWEKCDVWFWHLRNLRVIFGEFYEHKIPQLQAAAHNIHFISSDLLYVKFTHAPQMVLTKVLPGDVLLRFKALAFSNCVKSKST